MRATREEWEKLASAKIAHCLRKSSSKKKKIINYWEESCGKIFHGFLLNFFRRIFYEIFHRIFFLTFFHFLKNNFWNFLKNDIKYSKIKFNPKSPTISLLPSSNQRKIDLTLLLRVDCAQYVQLYDTSSRKTKDRIRRVISGKKIVIIIYSTRKRVENLMQEHSSQWMWLIFIIIQYLLSHKCCYHYAWTTIIELC
jgi:hypothetical protein